MRVPQAPLRSARDATAVLGKLVWMNLAVARRRGQLSHGLFVRRADVVPTSPASNAAMTGFWHPRSLNATGPKAG